MNNGQVNPHSDSSAAVHCSWAVMRHIHTFHLGSNQVLWVISKAPHKNLTQRERQRGLREKWSWGGGGGLGEETGRKGKESRRGAKEGNRRGEERVSPRGELNDINDALVWSGCESQQSPSLSTCYHGCCCCCWHPDSRAQIMKSGVFLCVCEEWRAQKCVCVVTHHLTCISCCEVTREGHEVCAFSLALFFFTFPPPVSSFSCTNNETVASKWSRVQQCACYICTLAGEKGK